MSLKWKMNVQWSWICACKKVYAELKSLTASVGDNDGGPGKFLYRAALENDKKMSFWSAAIEILTITN